MGTWYERSGGEARGSRNRLLMLVSFGGSVKVARCYLELAGADRDRRAAHRARTRLERRSFQSITLLEARFLAKAQVKIGDHGAYGFSESMPYFLSRRPRPRWRSAAAEPS